MRGSEPNGRSAGEADEAEVESTQILVNPCSIISRAIAGADTSSRQPHASILLDAAYLDALLTGCCLVFDSVADKLKRC
ncbi:unnamed protein product [Anisakis simplex]|uniref:Uncharacterized protein n=1 Tax=Anisakis simplex TaxID=6269 RepID=A0A0M3J0Y4_ANISI|nr:unnamed protein product [Anisakis simplex]